MLHTEMPRVSELYALSTSENAYFQDFDSKFCESALRATVWLAREKVLQVLDAKAWEYLKNELLQYLIKPFGDRGWSQFIDILNQAYAYQYLLQIGCRTPRFIPVVKQKGIATPDLEASQNGVAVLCEVKTFNISAAEVDARKTGEGRCSFTLLDKQFFTKLHNTLKRASQQMKAFDDSTNLVHIAYVVLNFDDSLGEHKVNHFDQIDQYLAAWTPGIQIVFHNQVTPFHQHIRMKHASVVNEDF